MARFLHGIVHKHKLLKQPLIVVNKGGGAGAEGFLEMKKLAGDPHNIVISLSNLFTTPYATGAPFSWKDLTPVALLALDQFVLWVPHDAPYEMAKDFIEAIKAAPDKKFRMGGTPRPRQRLRARKFDRHGVPSMVQASESPVLWHRWCGAPNHRSGVRGPVPSETTQMMVCPHSASLRRLGIRGVRLTGRALPPPPAHSTITAPIAAARYSMSGEGNRPSTTPRWKPMNDPAIPTNALVTSLRVPLPTLRAHQLRP